MMKKRFKCVSLRCQAILPSRNFNTRINIHNSYWLCISFNLLVYILRTGIVLKSTKLLGLIHLIPFVVAAN